MSESDYVWIEYRSHGFRLHDGEWRLLHDGCGACNELAKTYARPNPPPKNAVKR